LFIENSSLCRRREFFVIRTQKNDCKTVFSFLNLGAKFSEEILEYPQINVNTNISSACNDPYNVQNLNATISIHSDAIQDSMISLEKNIFLGYNLCADFFSHP